ncbi:MAG TPA: enoyl-ACP reductase [Chthonomonadaceae bacterium]|nr:enoyl-ACP reductase [Chthonomonadaceae bacterium]
MAAVMEGRNVLVAGPRNKWSLAWPAALALRREGARVAFSVKTEREASEFSGLLSATGFEAPVFLCDATDESQVEELFRQVSAVFDGRLDGLLHSIAFADAQDLSGEYIATSKEGYTLAQECSAYTLVSLARGARPLLQQAGGGSVVTLTYIGSERVVPNYNVMGVAKAALEASMRYLAADLGPENIRVNAVSAGAVKTLSARAVKGLDAMLKQTEERAPLRRRVDPEEVGDAILFLLSPWGRGVTGQVLYVDAGYHIVGMP